MPVSEINGHSHYYEDLGDGIPVVMLHGAAGSGAGFLTIATELSKEGFRVIVPDFRAMGRSEHVAEIPASAWVDDLLSLLDELGIDKAVIHGVSLGSRVALRFGLDNPNRTLGCILDAAIVANDPAGNAQLNRGFSPESMPQERKDTALRQHGENWAVVLQNFFNIRNEPSLQEFYNLRGEAKNCTVPVLIIRGDNVPDPVHPLDHSIELLKSIPGAQLAIHPNGQSQITNANPEIFKDLLRKFTSELTGK